jgi:hypothetical protein
MHSAAEPQMQNEKVKLQNLILKSWPFSHVQDQVWLCGLLRVFVTAKSF